MSKILVVEDEELVLKALEFRLKKEGHQVDAIRNGKEVSEIISKKKFDLIITDLMLPFIGGIDLIKEIRDNELSKDVPIFVMASNGLESVLMKTFEYKIQDFVMKPFHLNEIVIRVKKIFLYPSLF